MAEKKVTNNEKEQILKEILHEQERRQRVKDAAQVSKEQQNAITLMAHLDMSGLYEALGNFFVNIANVFNQFAMTANKAANDYKDQALKSLRDTKVQDDNKNSSR